MHLLESVLFAFCYTDICLATNFSWNQAGHGTSEGSLQVIRQVLLHIGTELNFTETGFQLYCGVSKHFLSTDLVEILREQSTPPRKEASTSLCRVHEQASRMKRKTSSLPELCTRSWPSQRCAALVWCPSTSCCDRPPKKGTKSNQPPVRQSKKEIHVACRMNKKSVW